jgi:hypothetical protein
MTPSYLMICPVYGQTEEEELLERVRKENVNV